MTPQTRTFLVADEEEAESKFSRGTEAREDARMSRRRVRGVTAHRVMRARKVLFHHSYWHRIGEV